MLRTLFIQIKNAQARRASVIYFYKSKAVIAALNVLQQNGYIIGYRHCQQQLAIYLKYKNQKPAINHITFFSELSLSIDQLARLYSNELLQGTFILSTSLGLMSDLTAHKLNVGGSVICKIE